MAKRKSFIVSLPGLRRIVRHFRPHIRPQFRLLLGAFLALMSETAMRLLEPWPLKIIFDRVILPSGFSIHSHNIESLSGLSPLVVLSFLSVALVRSHSDVAQRPTSVQWVWQ